MTSHETGAAGKPPSPRVLRLAVAGSALLMVGAGLVNFYASHQAQARRAANA